MQACDIAILGTGYFAEVMVNDLAATARQPVTVVIAGRNVERIGWLVTAANARASIFGSGMRFIAQQLDMGSVDGVAEGLARWDARVVVQCASMQSPWTVEGKGSQWAALVNEAGFGITLALQSLLPSRTAQALQRLGSTAAYVNTCYPDVVNQVLKAQGLPITCGVGNIAIFASVLGSRLPLSQRPRLRVLAHHQHLVEWRKPGQVRGGVPLRAWVDDQELDPEFCHCRDVQLPFRDLNVVSGASAVPVLLAMAGAGDCATHVPGPLGLPGGYPVQVSAKSVQLDLPAAVSQAEAVAWNQGFETHDGASVSRDGWVSYSPRARGAVARVSPSVAQGFHVRDLEQAYADISALRTRLGG